MASASTLTRRFTEFLRAQKLVQPRDRIVLAVSGGVDSMVMLHLFQELRQLWHLELFIAHVNHQLRGKESDSDEGFVCRTGERWNIPVYSTRADVVGRAHTKRISKQEAAREIRYAFFDEVLQRTSSNRIATAHQADDNAETVLMNAVRGGGVRSLAGIPVSRQGGRLIRPLLFARRKDILAYASEEEIAYREDSSNKSIVYARNYLRHRIVPYLKEEFGRDVLGLVNRLSDTVKKYSASLDLFVDSQSRSFTKWGEEGCRVFLPAFKREPSFLQEQLVLRILRTYRVEPSVVKVHDILALARRQSGHSLDLSSEMSVQKDHDLLDFHRKETDPHFSKNISIGETYRFPGFALTVGMPGPVPNPLPADRFNEFVDAQKLDEPLVVRTWNNGDWFIPFGMRGRKKLSDFFGDEKMPTRERTRIPILESHRSIVWVCGKRLDDRFKITSSTRRAIKLTYTPLSTSTHS